jgi:hypothetical protein
MVCKGCVEGRGNGDWGKVQSLGPRFGMDRAKTFSLKFPLPPVGLYLLLLIALAKNLEISTFKVY